MCNAWGLCLGLWHSEKVKVPFCDVECYEDLYERGGGKYRRLSTCQELVDGYGKSWLWALVGPRSVEIEGVATYCICLDEVRTEKNGQHRDLLIPFQTLIRILKAVRNEIKASKAE